MIAERSLLRGGWYCHLAALSTQRLNRGLDDKLSVVNSLYFSEIMAVKTLSLNLHSGESHSPRSLFNKLSSPACDTLPNSRCSYCWVGFWFTAIP